MKMEGDDGYIKADPGILAIVSVDSCVKESDTKFLDAPRVLIVWAETQTAIRVISHKASIHRVPTPGQLGRTRESI